jgi:hypothetical protein
VVLVDPSALASLGKNFVTRSAGRPAPQFWPLQQTLTTGHTPTSGGVTASQTYPDGQSDAFAQTMWPFGTLGENVQSARAHAKPANTSGRKRNLGMVILIGNLG